MIPNGIFIANSQCQLNVDKINPAIEGPAAELTATAIALMLIPLPNTSGG